MASRRGNSAGRAGDPGSSIPPAAARMGWAQLARRQPELSVARLAAQAIHRSPGGGPSIEFAARPMDRVVRRHWNVRERSSGSLDKSIRPLPPFSSSASTTRRRAPSPDPSAKRAPGSSSRESQQIASLEVSSHPEEKMDAILVPHPEGGFIPAGEAFAAGNAAAVAGNAAAGNAAAAAAAGFHPNPAFVAAAAAFGFHLNPAIVAGNPAGNVVNAAFVDADGFKLVVSRKFGMQRGAYRYLEDIPIEPPRAIELEFEWFPKSGPLRKVKKWAQLRKGGLIGTSEGMAVVTFPCYEP